MILINNINVPLDADFNGIKFIAAKKLGINIAEVVWASLYRKSVDARKKENVHFCISILCELKNEKKALKRCRDAITFEKREYIWKKSLNDNNRPVVVGFGPSGIFAALVLAKAGLKPIVLERGKAVDERAADVENFFSGGKLNPESNVQFGEGGAGTFSDGKLNTGIKDIRCRTVLEIFHAFGAGDNILIDAKPHIGTDVLKTVVKNIRQQILDLGGEIRFNSRLDNFFTSDGKLSAISVNGQKQTCERLVLCIGHSARDTFKILYENGLKMEHKPFSVGVRIEHLQSDINRALYGEFANHKALRAADYKMAVHLENGRGVYTFCMCPGGEVINASSQLQATVVNGMSNSARDGINANSALLVGIEPNDLPSDDIFAGCELQLQIEKNAYSIGNGAVPVTTVGHFVFGEEVIISDVKPTVKPRFVFSEFGEIFPEFIIDSLKEGIVKMDRKIEGFASHSAVLTAPETRSSSPIRILRDDSGQSVSIKGIYPCGEGAGYAGGIMSAAVDGIKIAEKVIDSLN